MGKKSMELTIQDISTLKGVYDDCIVLKNKLMKMMKVEGINLDLLDAFGKSQVFESYGSFLLACSTNKERLQNVSMTTKINMVRYNLFWKRKYLEAEKDTSLEPDKKENLLQLIASKCLYVEEISSKSEITTKQHLIVCTVPLESYSYQALESAREDIDEKVMKIKMIFKDALAEQSLEIEELTLVEMLDVLNSYTDNKTAMNI